MQRKTNMGLGREWLREKAMSNTGPRATNIEPRETENPKPDTSGEIRQRLNQYIGSQKSPNAFVLVYIHRYSLLQKENVLVVISHHHHSPHHLSPPAHSPSLLQTLATSAALQPALALGFKVNKRLIPPPDATAAAGFSFS